MRLPLKHIFIANLTETPDLIDSSCFDLFPNLRTHAKMFLFLQKLCTELPISFLFFEQMINLMYDENNIVRTIEQKMFTEEVFSNNHD